MDLGVVATPLTLFLPCEEPTAFKQTNNSNLGTATPCTAGTDLCPDRFTHLKVVPDFILQESRVFFQSPSELQNTGVDLQQLHRVAVVVPRRGDVLEHTGSPHTCCHSGLRTQKQPDDTSKDQINSPRPKTDQSLWTGVSSEVLSCGAEPRFVPPQIHSCDNK